MEELGTWHIHCLAWLLFSYREIPRREVFFGSFSHFKHLAFYWGESLRWRSRVPQDLFPQVSVAGAWISLCKSFSSFILFAVITETQTILPAADDPPVSFPSVIPLVLDNCGNFLKPCNVQRGVTKIFSHKIYRNLILSYGGAMRHGLIPNLLAEGHSARYNARDAVWFWLYAIIRYIDMAPHGEEILNCNVLRIFVHDDTVYGHDLTVS